MRRPGDRFLAWAERWLDETIVRDVVAPTVADLQREHRLARDDEQRRALRRHGWLVLGRTLAGSLGLGVGRSGSAPWWVLLAPLFVLMFSAHTLVVIEPSKAGRHMMFSGLGLVMAIAIVAAPARLARLQGVIAALVACGLTAVSLDGTMHLGVRRWLEIGPLTVHLAALVTPLYVGVLLGWAPSRRRTLQGSARSRSCASSAWASLCRRLLARPCAASARAHPCSHAPRTGRGRRGGC